MDNAVIPYNADSTDTTMEERIVAAAERLFIDKGFELATTTEIARAVGCNQALIHYYFRTKENLFRMIFKNKIISFWKSLIGAGWDGETFEEKVTRMIGLHFDMLYDDPKLPMFVIGELTRSPERLRLLIRELGSMPREFYLTFGRSLREAIDNGRIRPMRFIDVLYNILSMNVFIFLAAPVFGGVMNMTDEQLDRFIRRRKEETVESVLRSIRP